MSILETHFAKKSLHDIMTAYKTGRISDWAKAAGLNVDDPEIASLSVEEAFQVIEVRLADKLRRIKQLGVLPCCREHYEKGEQK